MLLLASRGKSTGMRHGDAQVFVRIYRSVVDPYFVVQVRPSAAAAQANIAQRIAALYSLPGDHGKIGQVPIPRSNAVPVVKNDRPSIAPHEVGEHHHTVRRSHN